MTIHDHNKRIFCAGVGCQNLGDLRKFIEKSDLPKNKKNQFCSAIKRADDLVGHGALDLPAAPHLILSTLDALSPARSEERRAGKEWVGSCRSRGSPDH